jgi:hypothetical protein
MISNVTEKLTSIEKINMEKSFYLDQFHSTTRSCSLFLIIRNSQNHHYDKLFFLLHGTFIWDFNFMIITLVSPNTDSTNWYFENVCYYSEFYVTST